MSTVCRHGWPSKKTFIAWYCISVTTTWHPGRSAVYGKLTASLLWHDLTKNPRWARYVDNIWVSCPNCLILLAWTEQIMFFSPPRGTTSHLRPLSEEVLSQRSHCISSWKSSYNKWPSLAQKKLILIFNSSERPPPIEDHSQMWSFNRGPTVVPTGEAVDTHGHPWRSSS